MKAKIYNRHTMVHREKFREELVTIQPSGFIVMDYEDAVLFKGQYFPMKTLPTGEPDPAGFKMLEIIPEEDQLPQVKRWICNIDGKEFATEDLLNEYIKSNHSEKIFKDDVLEEEIKRPRGRPPKNKDGTDEGRTPR